MCKTKISTGGHLGGKGKGTGDSCPPANPLELPMPISYKKDAISLRHNLATSGESRRVYRCLHGHPFCGWRYLATSRESKAHFGLPWVRPCDNRSKCYMDGKRIQCWSNASQHIPIYLQPFTSYRKILVGNIFIPHLCLAAPQISRRSCIGYIQN